MKRNVRNAFNRAVKMLGGLEVQEILLIVKEKYNLTNAEYVEVADYIAGEVEANNP